MYEPEVDENKDKELDPGLFENADEEEDTDDDEVLAEGADPLRHVKKVGDDHSHDPEVDSVDELAEEEEAEAAKEDSYDDLDLL